LRDERNTNKEMNNMSKKSDIEYISYADFEGRV